ncbi:MAG: SCO family protein [Gammaproteobacteria bacterium]|nr:SCO family protein [Gammaproteobacteria bacterium]
MRKSGLILACLTAVLAAACGGELSWQTKDISGMMPALEFTLTSEDGKTVTEDHYTGNVNLVFFGFTHCPDICPITLGRLRGVMDRLPGDVAHRVQVLFVSVDPDRDGPEELRTYTDQFGTNFIGLTGSQEQLQALTKRYRTTYGYGEPDDQGNYEVSHGSAVYAFDSSGAARLLIRNSDDVDAVASDLEQLVQG